MQCDEISSSRGAAQVSCKDRRGLLADLISTLKAIPVEVRQQLVCFHCAGRLRPASVHQPDQLLLMACWQSALLAVKL